MLGELTEQEILEILGNNIIGRIACNDEEKNYIVPVSYLFRDGYVLCHSRMGMKIEMMRRNPHVCFEIDEIRDYNNWRCVIAWGIYKELLNEEEINEAKKYFSDYMLTMKTSKTGTPPEMQGSRPHEGEVDFAAPIFYKIELTELTGRFEKEL